MEPSARNQRQAHELKGSVELSERSRTPKEHTWGVCLFDEDRNASRVLSISAAQRTTRRGGGSSLPQVGRTHSMKRETIFGPTSLGANERCGLMWRGTSTHPNEARTCCVRLFIREPQRIRKVKESALGLERSEEKLKHRIGFVTAEGPGRTSRVKLHQPHRSRSPPLSLRPTPKPSSSSWDRKSRTHLRLRGDLGVPKP